MANNGVMFTAAAADRIAKAVRRVEKLPRETAGQRVRPEDADLAFWGYTVGCDITGFRHSFVRVYPDASGDSADFVLARDRAFKLQEDDPVTLFSEAAREVNGGKGIINTIVRLFFSGYDANGEPAYMFDRPQPEDYNLMQVHDHRSNDAGGFAFAVMHPGTSLPQQKWALY